MIEQYELRRNETQITLVTHSLYVKLSKNSKDYGAPDITYQLAALSNANHDGMSHVISWESSLLIISYKTIF